MNILGPKNFAKFFLIISTSSTAVLLSYCGLVDARIRASEKRFTCTKKNGPPEIISTNCTHQEHSTYYLLNYLAIYKTNFSEILTT